MKNRNYKTIIDHRVEDYPWENYIPANATKLILGTFPTKLSLRAFEFYYPNKQNRMWEILFKIARQRFDSNLEGEQAVIERKEVLKTLKLGMDDIGKRIYRMGNSSLDMNIYPVEYSNIFKILDEHPAIQKIIITSSSKGHSVLSWFKHYCALNEINLDLPKKAKVPYSGRLDFFGRSIEVSILYSVSGAAGKATDVLVKMYAEAISD